tara:strand:- start:344 stop:718 length:375 start_codon:yes stop_codon:yes gene_type:complete
MNFNSDFKYDLKLGLKGENLVFKLLTNKKIEVKTDYKALETGNIFIEYYSRNKLSGIATTEAEFWVFVLSNELLIFIETNKLKKLCKLPNLKKVLGGDNNTSKGVLLPLKLITQQHNNTTNTNK